jgi:hypothetical protein
MIAISDREFGWAKSNNRITFCPANAPKNDAAQYVQDGFRRTLYRLPEQTSIEIDSATLARYAGKYEFDGRLEVDVVVENSSLIFHSTNLPPIVGLPKSATVFFARDHAIEIEFEADGDGPSNKLIIMMASGRYPCKRIGR